MPILFIFFIFMPIIEVFVLIKVGGSIGALNTAGLVVLTALIGGWLLRQQGIATLFNAKQRMASGEIPASEMVQGLMLAVGGALLLTPGFVTDLLGFILLLPTTRKHLADKVLQSVQVQSVFMSPSPMNETMTNETLYSDERDSSGDTIEGEFKRND
jgi:UPF0716 protein FxsA